MADKKEKLLDEWSEVTAYIDGELTGPTVKEFEEKLETNPSLQSLESKLRRVIREVQQHPPETTTSEYFRKQVLQAIGALPEPKLSFWRRGLNWLKGVL